MGAPYPFWNSGTSGKGTAPYNLVLQDDGNLVLYDAGSTGPDPALHIWSSGTNGKGTAPFNLTMQNDGADLLAAVSGWTTDMDHGFI